MLFHIIIVQNLRLQMPIMDLRMASGDARESGNHLRFGNACAQFPSTFSVEFNDVTEQSGFVPRMDLIDKGVCVTRFPEHVFSITFANLFMMKGKHLKHIHPCTKTFGQVNLPQPIEQFATVSCMAFFCQFWMHSSLNHVRPFMHEYHTQGDFLCL